MLYINVVDDQCKCVQTFNTSMLYVKVCDNESNRVTTFNTSTLYVNVCDNESNRVTTFNTFTLYVHVVDIECRCVSNVNLVLHSHACKPLLLPQDRRKCSTILAAAWIFMEDAALRVIVWSEATSPASCVSCVASLSWVFVRPCMKTVRKICPDTSHITLPLSNRFASLLLHYVDVWKSAWIHGIYTCTSKPRQG